jgi:predicted permease
MHFFVPELRYAFRGLRRSPAFAAAAILTLALGIGATTAIFTVASATIFASPPYPEHQRLFVLTAPDAGAGSQQEFAFVRERSRTMAAMAAQRSTPGWSLVAGSYVEFVEGLEVTDGYFETLGIGLLLGRGIAPAEATVGGPRSVVLSEPLWRRAFSARADVLGEVVTLGGRPHTVVGVAPPGLRSNPQATVWVAMQIPVTSNAANQLLFGRIAAGRTRADALAELDAMRGDLRAALTVPSRIRRVDVLTWMPYQQWTGGGVRGLLVRVLLGAVGFLLLLACVNIAGLQLARGVTRTRDFATQAALGASRWRLLGGPLTESMLLACAGAVGGLGVALIGSQALVALLSPDVRAEFLAGESLSIDARAIGFTALLAIGSALLFGLAPAFSAIASRRGLLAAHREHHTPSRRTLWLRRSFAVGQMALAIVLLVGAGLLVRTFITLRGAELGFDPASIVIGELSVQAGAVEPLARNTFIAQTVASVRQLPGVSGIAISNRVPVDVATNVAVRGTGATLVTEARSVDWSYVTDDYFAMLQIPLTAGRSFDSRDALGAPPVAIVNEAFARAYFGRVNVVGESVETMVGREPVREIVGVVADTKSRSNAGWTSGISALGSANPPILYVPAAQASAGVFSQIHQFSPMRLIVKSAAGVAIEAAVRDAIRRVDPMRPFIRFLTMEQIIRRDLDLQRLLMILVTTVSAIAVTLAIVGLYALVSYLAAQRTREVGIRIAVGATAGRVAALFLREGLGLGVTGVVLGVAGATFATRALMVFLVGVTPTDVPTIAAVAGAFIGVVVLATLLPARRAASLNPVEALRTE